MASAEVTVNVHVEGLTQKVLDFLKLGPPIVPNCCNECGYCGKILDDDSMFTADGHNEDCAWARFAQDTVGDLKVT